MIFNPARGYLFIHIQKTAGTSITQLLGAMEGSRIVTPAHLLLRDVRLSPVQPKPFIFAVVRNPWERLASWYAMMRRKGVHNEFSRYLLTGREPGASVDFSTFIRRTAVIREGGHEVHGPGAFVTMPGLEYHQKGLYEKSLAFNQVDYLTDHHGRFCCDEVLRFENLGRDLPALLRRLHPSAAAIPIPRANVNPVPLEDWRSLYVNPADREFVARLYERDIRHWAFDRP